MTIDIQELGSKEVEQYKIVGTTEANILADIPKISNESPIGKALLGKKKGDTLELKNRAGESVTYTILAVI